MLLYQLLLRGGRGYWSRGYCAELRLIDGWWRHGYVGIGVDGFATFAVIVGAGAGFRCGGGSNGGGGSELAIKLILLRPGS